LSRELTERAPRRVELDDLLNLRGTQHGLWSDSDTARFQVGSDALVVKVEITRQCLDRGPSLVGLDQGVDLVWAEFVVRLLEPNRPTERGKIVPVIPLWRCNR
jgi:hypothetical protein